MMGSYSYESAADEAWTELDELKPDAFVFATVPIVRPTLDKK